MNKVVVKIAPPRKQNLNWSFRTAFKIERKFHNRAKVIKKENCRTNLNKLTVLLPNFHYNYVKNKYSIKV